MFQLRQLKQSHIGDSLPLLILWQLFHLHLDESRNIGYLQFEQQVWDGFGQHLLMKCLRQNISFLQFGLTAQAWTYQRGHDALR